MKEIESWQNNKWIPNSIIGTKLYDAHYFFGYAVFDAFRTYNHKPHLMDQHIDRLYRSMKMTGIEIPYSKEDIIKIVFDMIEHNKEFFTDNEYRFMLFCSPGFFKIYDDMGIPEPILTINVTTTSRYAKHIVPYIEKGYTALVSSQPQIPSRFLDPKVKHCSRLHYGLADFEASRYGEGVQPILLDEDGYITESSGSNIILVKDNVFCFPCGDMLHGVTSEFVESLLFFEGYTVKHEQFDVYDLLDADMVLFTSTFSGLMPCYSIIHRNKKYVLHGYPDFKRIVSLFNKSVGVDCYKQWNDWFFSSVQKKHSEVCSYGCA